MSTEIEPDLPWIATLMRGEVYDLGGPAPIIFMQGVPHPVSQAQRDHLEEHAVERRVSPGWNPDYDAEEDRIEVVAAFTFKTNDGSANNVDRPRTLHEQDQPRPGTRAYAKSRNAEARAGREVAE